MTEEAKRVAADLYLAILLKFIDANGPLSPDIYKAAAVLAREAALVFDDVAIRC